MKNKKSSPKPILAIIKEKRWILSAFLFVLVVVVTLVTTKSSLFQGGLLLNQPPITEETCVLVNQEWDQGAWTDRHPNDNFKPALCEEHYPEIWYGVTEVKCETVKAILQSGKWTESNPGSNLHLICSVAYPEMWNTPSEEACEMYEEVWQDGEWTARFAGNVDLINMCKAEYPELDFSNPANLERCQEVKAEFSQGDWTERHPDSSLHIGCSVAFRDMWDTPSREICEMYQEVWNTGNWTSRFGPDSRRLINLCESGYDDIDFDSPINPERCEEIRDELRAGFWTARNPGSQLAGMCSATYPEVWNSPSRESCEEVEDLWSEGGWTNRFPGSDEPRQCDRAYPELEFDQPTANQCREARELWGEINWTARFGHAGLPFDCKRFYPEIWNEEGQPEPPIPRGTPPAGYEDEVEVIENENPFSDVDGNTDIGRAAIALYYRAVIGGYPDGTFRAHREINRAEAIKFMLLAGGYDVPDQVSARDIPFTDVPADAWYAPYVVVAEANGLVHGYADGSFRGGTLVNTAEYLIMLMNVFEDLENDLPHNYVDVEPGVFYEDAAGVADWYGLFPERGENLQPAEEVKRGEAAFALYQLMLAGIWN